MIEKTSIRSRAPQASSPKVRLVMQRNRGRETAPEKSLASSLRTMGFSFRKDVKPEDHLNIRGDIVFFQEKICIFVDGCFWHGCPFHLKLPKTHSDWWDEKITDNKDRDMRQTRELQSNGWTVLRFWEHDISPTNLPSVCLDIRRFVRIR